MRIAILGTRGIPARYGGFETFAEELSWRLVERGHTVTVYCREKPEKAAYRGVTLQYIPTLRHKYADTLVHTFISTLHLLRRRQEAAIYCNGANAIFTALPKAAGIPVALNVDGLERKRKKWNALARAWYQLSESLATFCPTAIVTDAREIRDYYLGNYGAESTFIPYGAPIGKLESTAALRQLGLEPDQYLLYVTRFEPENNPLMVRRAFERVSTDMKLALVGDAPYAADYIRAVRDTKDERILIPGSIYGTGYHELQSHSYAYVHATEVGGTHPALIEAMGRGALILYLMTPENHEVAGGAGIPFHDEQDLTLKLRDALALLPDERRAYCDAAMARVKERYSWESVTVAYENLLRRLVEGRS